MFLTMFFKTQNIVPTMHLTMLIAHPYPNMAFYKPLFNTSNMFWKCLATSIDKIKIKVAIVVHRAPIPPRSVLVL